MVRYWNAVAEISDLSMLLFLNMSCAPLWHQEQMVCSSCMPAWPSQAGTAPEHKARQCPAAVGLQQHHYYYYFALVGCEKNSVGPTGFKPLTWTEPYNLSTQCPFSWYRQKCQLVVLTSLPYLNLKLLLSTQSFLQHFKELKGQDRHSKWMEIQCSHAFLNMA